MNTSNMKRALCALALPVILSACVKEVNSPAEIQEDLHEAVFHAGWDPETKTVLQEDGSIFWSPGDTISLFIGDSYDGGYELISTNLEPAAKVDFVGQIGENPNRESYIAGYPYNAIKYNTELQSMLVNIPTIQEAVEGSFDKNAFISVAVSEDSNLFFRNACGGIKFSVSRSDIKEVVIDINTWSDHYCSGTLMMKIVDGVPVIDSRSYVYSFISHSPESSNCVTVVAPNNGTFDPNKEYYAVMAPSDYYNGISITYKTTDYTEATLSLPATTISRGVFKRVIDGDNGLTYHVSRGKRAELPARGTLNEYWNTIDVSSIKHIVFYTRSNIVTDRCVPLTGDYPVYLKNEDNVISLYTEADSYRVQNPDFFFQDFTSLENVDLSSWDLSSATSFQGVFENCHNLKSIEFGDIDVSEVRIFQYAFYGCRSLTSLDLSSFHSDNTENMSSMFNGCSKLKTLDLSSFTTTNVTDMSYMFYNCVNLDYINLSSFSSESLKIAFGMFSLCSRLTKLDLGYIDLSTVSEIHSLFMGLGQVSRNLGIACVENTKNTIISNIANTHLPFNGNHITWLSPGSDLSPFIRIYNPDLYYSSDFSRDGEVQILQACTEGNGVDLVFVGDGYSDRLIESGKYLSDAQSAINDIFSHEPFTSYRNLFNIYLVNAVSENEVLGESTALGFVGGTEQEELVAVIDSDALTDYIFKASDKQDVYKIATIVLLNASTGRSLSVSSSQWSPEMFFDYPAQHASVSYVYNHEIPNTTVHEFGHSFARLADEYVDYYGFFEDWELNHVQDMMTHLGWYSNVDFTSDLESIKWNRFINDPRYSNENIGAYEGGFHYMNGVWRATQNSIMIVSGEFNAPSREAIYKRIHKLAYGEDWQYDYETFVQQDLKNIPSTVTNAVPTKYVPYPARVNKKPYFKMEESTAPDGKRKVTVIMD